MKGLGLALLASLMLAMGCQEAPKGYVIKGEVADMPTGKVFLKVFRNKMFFDVDTAEVKEGKFTFEGVVDQPLLYGLATEEMVHKIHQRIMRYWRTSRRLAINSIG